MNKQLRVSSLIFKVIIKLIHSLISHVLKPLLLNAEFLFVVKELTCQGHLPVLLLAAELLILIQEVVILVQLSARLNLEDQVLIVLVFLGDDVVLYEQITELLLKEIVPINLTIHVLSQLLVGSNHPLQVTLILQSVGLFHLSAVKSLLQSLNSPSHGWLIGTTLKLLVELSVLIPKLVNFIPLLVNHLSQRINHLFQFSHRLCGLAAEFHTLARFL